MQALTADFLNCINRSPQKPAAQLMAINRIRENTLDTDGLRAVRSSFLSPPLAQKSDSQ